MQITASYDGKAPNLCMGRWTIEIEDYSFSNIEGDMATAGTYDSWSFGDDYDVIWESYEAGYPFGIGWLVLAALEQA